MKTQIIQLDEDDDTNSIRYKMSWVKSNRIILVWPMQPLNLNHLDLVLILRACQSLGAQLGLVVNDEEIRLVSIGLGIPVFASIALAQKSTWKRRWKKLRTLPQKPTKSFVLKMEIPRLVRVSRFINIYRWVVFTSSCLAIITLIFLLIPSARITIYPSRIVQSVEIEVRASPKISEINLNGGVPAEVRSIVVEAQASKTATGSLRIPVKSAIGTVVFTNLSNEPVLIPAGLIVATADTPTIRFLVATPITLEGKNGFTREVQIQAVLPGESGNVYSKKITIVEGTIGTKVIVNNPAPTIGGAEQLSTAPSKQDQDELRIEVKRQLITAALREFQNNITDEIFILPSLELRKILKEEFEADLSLPAERLRITTQAEFQGWVVRESNLKKLGLLSLNSVSTSNYREIPLTLRMESQNEYFLSGENVGWQVRFEHLVEENFSSEWLARAIVGKSPGEAQSILNNLVSSRQSPMVQINPYWWTNVPLLGVQIEVVKQ